MNNDDANRVNHNPYQQQQQQQKQNIPQEQRNIPPANFENPYQAFHENDIAWATDLPAWNHQTERHENLQEYTLMAHLKSRWKDLSDLRENGSL